MKRRITNNEFGIESKAGRIEQACARYGVGRTTMRNIAKEAGAEIKVGKRRVIEFFIYPIIQYLDEGLSVR